MLPWVGALRRAGFAGAPDPAPPSLDTPARRPPGLWPLDRPSSPRTANQACLRGFRRVSDTLPRICSLQVSPLSRAVGATRSRLLVFLPWALDSSGERGDMAVSQPGGAGGAQLALESVDRPNGVENHFPSQPGPGVLVQRGQQAHTPTLPACLVLTSFTQASCVRLTLLGRLFPKMLLFRALAHGLSLKCPTRWRRPSPLISTMRWHPLKSRPGLGSESGRGQEATRGRPAADMRSSVSQGAPNLVGGWTPR